MQEHVFLSQEWMEAVVKTVNESEELREKNKDFSGTLRLIVTDLPGPVRELHGGRKELAVFLRVEKGVCEEFRMLSSPEEQESEFQAKGTYETWKKIFQGKAKLMFSVFTRKIKVEARGGLSFSFLKKSLGASLRIMKVMRQIPVRYLDEA
jgi:putative sterol carrier protein